MANCRVLQSGVMRMTQPFHYAGQKGYNYAHLGIDLVDFSKGYNALGYIVAHTAGKVVGIETRYTGPTDDGSYGNYVLIMHQNGYSTMYAHLASGTTRVKLGQWVSQGQVLAYMDNTGYSFGGHLHFEIRDKNGTKIDPEPYMNAPLPGMKRWVKYINGGWYAVKDGVIDSSYNGVAENENGWWKIKNGKVDFTFKGLAQNENGWWYLNGGKVDFKKNSIVQNSLGWWKVTKGQVDFTYNGLAQNENGWFFLQDGKVDFTFDGLAPNDKGTWVLQKGKINFNYTGNYIFSGVNFRIKAGKVV